MGNSICSLRGACSAHNRAGTAGEPGGCVGENLEWLITMLFLRLLRG